MVGFQAIIAKQLSALKNLISQKIKRRIIVISTNYFIVHYKSAIDSIRRSKVQSLMVILSLAVASASLCLYLAVSKQNPNKAANSVFLVSSTQNEAKKNDQQFEATNTSAFNYSLIGRDSGSISFESKSKDVPFIKADTNMVDLLNLKMAYGQSLDGRSNEQSIVIGNNVAKQIFDRPSESIGRHVMVNNSEKVIVGILSKNNGFDSQLLNDIDNIVIGALSDDDNISNIIVSNKDGSDVTQQQLTGYFANLKKDEFKINPLELSVSSKAEQKLAENLRYSTRYTTFVALLLSGFCIFITILLSANQKIKEIGIRKTIGATNKQISMHFIYESLILGFLGGLLGCIIAQLILSTKLNALVPNNYIVDLKSSLLSLVACILISLFFGLIPAINAGRKNPIECLKYSL